MLTECAEKKVCIAICLINEVIWEPYQEENT